MDSDYILLVLALFSRSGMQFIRSVLNTENKKPKHW